MLALGAAVMVTLAVALTAEQPAAAIVYVTVYIPAVLVLGMIAPVLALMLKPAVEEYVPPVVPVCVTVRAVVIVVHHGEPE